MARKMKGLRKIWPIYLLLVAAILRSIPQLPVPAAIFMMVILLWCDLFFARHRAAVLFLLPGRRKRLFAFFVLFMMWIAVPSSFYSDDWIRHVYDGLQLLHHEPVYRVAPQDLPLPDGLDLLPSHAHRQTIYLPATQLQAITAAFLFQQLNHVVGLSASSVFAIVFSGITSILLSAVWKRLNRSGRMHLVTVMGSAAFLIFAASLHADVQGMFGALLLLAALERDRQSRLSGPIVVLLPLLKPEGIVYSISAIVASLKRMRRSVILPGGITLLLMTAFSIRMLWPSVEDFTGFLEQVSFFSEWWMAYHPVIYLLERNGLNIRDAASLYHLIVFPGILLLTGWTFRRDLRKPWIAIVAPLIVYFFWRITLHPWYFLGFVPVLVLRGAHKVIRYFPILLLWYVVLPVYRSGQGWDEGLFFALLGVHAIVLLLIDRNPLNRLFKS